MGKQRKNPVYVKSGEFLRERRLLAGLSQDEVAESLGYSSSRFVASWEDGIAAPPMGVLTKIMDIYDGKSQLKKVH